MKNTFKFSGIIALVAIIGFTMAACGDDGDPELPGTLTISVEGGGDPAVGRKLSATYSGRDEASSVSFTWTRGSTEVGTRGFYTPEVAGKHTVTASADGFKSISASVEVITLPKLEGKPTISGLYALVEDVLTASTPGMNGTGTYSFQWKKGTGDDATDIGTGTTYTVVEDDLGSAITVTVTCTSHSGSQTSDLIEVVKAAPKLTWTAIPADGHPFNGRYTGPNAIAWGDSAATSKFVAGGGTRIAYSTDGVTWTEVTAASNILNFTVVGIAYDNRAASSKFVAVGYSGNDARTAYSTDGVTWYAGPQTGAGSLELAFGGYNPSAIAFGNEKFVVVGRHEMAYSTDGTTWTKVGSTDVGLPFGGDFYSITWGSNGSTVNRFVAGGSVGYAPSSTAGTGGWSSTKVTAFGNISISGIAYGGPTGSERFVAVGGNGLIVTSTNGTTWGASVADSTFGATGIRAVTWGGETGNEMFVAVGSDGKMATSPNGTIWTAVPARVSTFGDSWIQDIAWGGTGVNKKFVAVGMTRGDQSGIMAYSSYPAE